nr:nucleotidyltransferase family protein [uncultured Vibrio sp.]
MFECVILAGGKGTRLKSVTGDLPKPMVEINGIPFLYLVMKRLEAQGCEKIILSLGYQANYIVERILEDRPVSCKLEYVIEDNPLGTGGAIKLAAKKVKSSKFLVLNGDTYCDIPFKPFFDYAFKFDLTIAAVEVEDSSRYGTVISDNKNNILALREKSETGRAFINSGLYCVSRDSILLHPYDSFSFEEDYIDGYEGICKAYNYVGTFIDIGIPDAYYKACQVIS